MARKIFRSGNSTVVSLPPDALEALRLDVGDEVTVAVEGGRIVLTPAQRPLPEVHPDFVEEVDRFIDRYGSALERLAGEAEA